MIWISAMDPYAISLGEKGDQGTEAAILEKSHRSEDREVGFKEKRSRARTRRIVEAKRGGSFKKKRLKIESGPLAEWP